MFDPDILAVQEIDGVEALRRVVDTDIYNINVSSRPKSPNLNGKQNTGFAYKKGLIVEQLEDFDDLNVTGNLRHGALIRLKHNGLSVKLMSVHLKSACFDDSFSGEACESLYRQIPILETWIDSAAKSDEPFIILGDFNRRFNALGDSVWKEIDDGDPPNADLTTATENKSISCRENKYTMFIDHIVFDKRAWRWVEDSSFRHQTFRQQDKTVWRKISDHCPVVVDLWIE
jgi:endonuclease/exonuclease/phosphatase family metal-dependent hydrolase